MDIMKIAVAVKTQIILAIVLELVVIAITYAAWAGAGGNPLAAVGSIGLAGLIGLLIWVIVIWAGLEAAKKAPASEAYVSGAVAGAVVAVISGIIGGILQLLLIAPMMLAIPGLGGAAAGLGAALGIGALIIGLIVGIIIGAILGLVGAFLALNVFKKK